jgi:hypothetical protein
MDQEYYLTLGSYTLKFLSRYKDSHGRGVLELSKYLLLSSEAIFQSTPRYCERGPTSMMMYIFEIHDFKHFFIPVISVMATN